MYYFAYGSNMNIEHMRRLCGWHCRMLCRSKLVGYEIGLDMRGYTNIRPKQGDTVWGVMYEIDQDGIDMLDKFEGAPDVYNRKEVVCLDDNNVEYRCQVYIEAENEFGGTKAREEFFRRVVGAAYENHLPETWIEKLESFLELTKK